MLAGSQQRRGSATSSRVALELEYLQQYLSPVDAVTLFQQSGQILAVPVRKQHILPLELAPPPPHLAAKIAPLFPDSVSAHYLVG